ncbi:hypothetical protein ABQF08_21965 [Xanthomonas campestris pv. campestris]|uniref:hypothetical protein n=1 Tax=Xanthomonas campestris TaxID=339 RepID=UPI00114CF13E|nr:hypothetical protein [Xanthomonas campestris]MCC3256521.1 hypothetical protein [Xanthomonas campestris pv. armoraciae]MCF8792764.1 hypothetical protein [Xanthomonas campestris pv. campestris]MCF8874104.1 hypothetical protein [Xanthomonas campestris pv. campestris]MCF8874259.1 hypothetical protein [Xanthomonas campestris pv. campestris]MEA0659876.1 hypothetical protein [Xanthomonas campestris pv. campestris]
MPDVIAISKIVGASAAILASLTGFIIWLRPVKIVPGIHLVFDGSGPDEITATITNRSGKPIYVTSCVSRGTYPWQYSLMRHLRQPFLAPRFYPVIWFGGPVHELFPGGPIKIEPQQPIDLRHRLCSHWISKFHNRQFLIEVQLSNGRKFRSRRQKVPMRWRLQNAS